ncbi:hypothetical protein RND81_09G178900 [Saponaria officinalis]|uniref:Uncharacterized protein n=1 Tax=Saponaria officinalis TaxID=3572 RepID=A0AAW1IPS3_SAPOF
MAKMKPLSKSMSAHDFVPDFNPDFSIALPYTGSPLNHTFLPKVLPLDLHSIPTAKPALSLPLLDPFSLPVVQPVSFAAFPDSYSGACRDFHSFKGFDKCSRLVSFSGDLEHDKCLPMSCNGVIESSGSLGFSTSTRDHSHEFSESSNMLDTPLDRNDLDILGLQNGMSNSDHITRALSGVICYEEEEEEESDGEHLECRRTKKPNVTFRDQEDSNDMIYQEDSVYPEDEFSRERPVAQKPPKRGRKYCLVCEDKYCHSCILRAMGSMSEGRKCLTCIGYPVDDLKRHRLGRCSRILKGLLKEEEIKQIMNNEVSCATNQLPPECIFVNGSPLRIEELMELRNCSNPPTCLNPGNYWYDRVSGFWGKEGQKPCQIISPHLKVGDPKMKRDSSNGNTNVLINGREITTAELWMLKVVCHPIYYPRLLNMLFRAFS